MMRRTYCRTARRLAGGYVTYHAVRTDSYRLRLHTVYAQFLTAKYLDRVRHRHRSIPYSSVQLSVLYCLNPFLFVHFHTVLARQSHDIACYTAPPVTSLQFLALQMMHMSIRHCQVANHEYCIVLYIVCMRFNTESACRWIEYTFPSILAFHMLAKVRKHPQ